MFRIPSLTIVFVLAAGTAALAQLPPQPPPVAMPMGAADEKERAACHPDVTKFCKHELDVNAQDTFSILGCLQRNRSGISPACSAVLSSHGQ